MTNFDGVVKSPIYCALYKANIYVPVETDLLRVQQFFAVL